MQLTMSNDYAAIISGVIAAILVIGTVELQTYARTAAAHIDEDGEPLQEVFEELLTTMREGREPEQQQLERLREMTDSGQLPTRLRRVVGAGLAGLWWAVVCTTLVATELLVILWAAIDKHGPAPWLAWLSVLSSGVGVLTLMLFALRRSVTGQVEMASPFSNPREILALRRYIRLSFQQYWERQPEAREDSGTESRQPDVS